MKNGGLILSSAIAFFEMFKTSWQMGKHLTIQRTSDSVGFADILSSYFSERPGNSPPIWSESVTRNISWIFIVCGGEFGKEIFWSQTLRSWKIWLRQKPMLEDSVQIITPKMVKNFIFPIADETVKFLGGDHGIGKSTSMRDQLVRGEELSGDLRGKPATIVGRSKGITFISSSRRTSSSALRAEGRHIATTTAIH